MTGVFFAIVGPSGAGKDTLITYARNSLTEDPHFVFPQRSITRPVDPRGEDHRTVSNEQFVEISRDGGFFLEWQAHGLRYGLPAHVAGQLAEGKSVVANVSRAAIGRLCTVYETVHVIQVTAELETIAARLDARDRETPQEIKQRLARAAGTFPDGVPVNTICNDGPIEQAGTRMVHLLMEVVPHSMRPDE